MAESLTQSSTRDLQLQEACAELERRLQTGEPRAVEAVLAVYPELAADPDCALQLVYNELVGRERRGEQPAYDEYYQRFPHWREELRKSFDVHEALVRRGMALDEEAIVIAALEMKSADQRAAYLDTACAGQSGLRRKVEELLSVHAQADPFLDGTAAAWKARLPTGDPQPLAEAPGTVIGPYQLLEPIGEGGFGVVFLAEQQQPIRRKVALKVVKPGMDSAQVIARFEAERQALALMDHPHIAKVLDAGTVGEPGALATGGAPVAKRL
jgi:hypothetical protein